MNPITRSVNLSNTSATNIAAAQTIGAAGNLVLTATAAAIDTSGAARIILFTTTENDSSINATITGLDSNGNAISETLALPNNTTGVSTKAYNSISQIAVSSAIASNISVGTTNTTLTAIDKLIALDFYNRVAPQVAVEVTGTINYTIAETFDQIMDGTVTANKAIMFKPTALASKTSNTVAQLDIGATGVQVQVNSFTNGATLTARIIQSTNTNNG